MSERPNILVVLQDQLRYDLVDRPDRCRTPNLDSFRAAGTWFTRAYTPCGICGPARASIFTGLYPHTHGVLNNVSGTDAAARNLTHDFPTVAELLAKAGYRTGYVGKWHVGVEEQADSYGFDDVRLRDADTWGAYKSWAARFAVGNPAAVHTRYPPPLPRLAERFPRIPFPMYSTEDTPSELIPAHGVAEQAVEMLREYSEGEQPFFLVVSFLEPHWPHVLPEPYASMYDPDAIAPWPNFSDTFERKPGTNQAGLEHFGVTDLTWDDWKLALSRYFGAVSFLDDLVGRVLDGLDTAGRADDTVVLCSADHGDMAGSHRQFNKGPFMYEEVYRLPFVWRGPGVAAGARTDALASHVDVLPTLLELADTTPPERTHGRSLVPVLGGRDDGWRDALLSEFHGDEFGLYSQRMIRTGHHKFIYNPNDVRELYDLDADPDELHNLAGLPEHRDLQRELEGRLLELMHDSDDTLRLWAVNTLG